MDKFDPQFNGLSSLVRGAILLWNKIADQPLLELRLTVHDRGEVNFAIGVEVVNHSRIELPLRSYGFWVGGKIIALPVGAKTVKALDSSGWYWHDAVGKWEKYKAAALASDFFVESVTGKKFIMRRKEANKFQLDLYRALFETPRPKPPQPKPEPEPV